MMKKIFFLFLLSACVAESAKADVIARWTFETNPPADVTDSSSISGISADEGIGIASGFHLSTITDWTTPAGNGSANSLNANNWQVGDYFQFSVATLGFSGVKLSWDQTASGTGPGQFKLQYRSGGGAFTDWSDYTAIGNTNPPGFWNSTTNFAAYNLSFDLSSLTAIDNQSSVDFRLVMRSTVSTGGGIVAAGGTARVDNFTVSASAVPEPTSAGLLALTGVAGLAFRRRRS